MLRFKKLSPQASAPFRASSGAAGYDLAASTSAVVPAYATAKLPTGLAVEIPPGHYGLIKERSSTALHHSLTTCAGVIDSDYRGELSLLVFNFSSRPKLISAGQRLAQLIVMPYAAMDVEEVETLTETVRGDGGFGST